MRELGIAPPPEDDTSSGGPTSESASTTNRSSPLFVTSVSVSNTSSSNTNANADIDTDASNADAAPVAANDTNAEAPVPAPIDDEVVAGFQALGGDEDHEVLNDGEDWVDLWDNLEDDTPVEQGAATEGTTDLAHDNDDRDEVPETTRVEA